MLSLIRLNVCNNTRISRSSSLWRNFGLKVRLPRTHNKSSNLVTKLSGGLVLATGGLGLELFRCGSFPLSRVKCDRLDGLTLADAKQTKTQFDFQFLWIYLKPHLTKFLGAICAALAVAWFNIQIPNLLGSLINTIAQFSNSSNGSTEFLKAIREPLLRIISIYVLQAGFTAAYISLLSQIGERMAAKIRQDLFDRLIVQDLAFFDKLRTGELINRLSTDVQEFKSSFKQCVSQGLRSMAQLVGGGISLFLISPHMATIALISVPTAVLLFSALGTSLRELSKRSQAQNERATAVCTEALANIRTVRANASENLEIEMFERETNASADYAERLGNGIAGFQALTNFMLNTMIASTLFIGGYLMSSHELTPGQLMAFLVAAQGMQRSLTQGSLLLGSIIRGMDAGARVFEYMQLSPHIDISAGRSIPQAQLAGAVSFCDVSFSYPSRPGQVLLKDFQLTIQAGQTVALVGASGSGKSTIAALLERFYEPDNGVITLDGVPLYELSGNWLRGKVIGFIEQQPVLFATTIYENIRYGYPDASRDEVEEAARMAQAHSFIENLPQGYGTQVGERGVQLSGGQRQRIAIARALLKRPAILILDEATSALDVSSEAEVQRALDVAVKNRTTLVIAHRLSTIRNADLIVVLDNGRVVEMGTHMELMARPGGLYANLIRLQENQDAEELSGNRKSG